MNKKTFIVNLNLFYCSIFIPLMYDFIVFIFLEKIKTIELAITLIIIICFLHSISFILGCKTISFKGEKIVYKKNIFSKTSLSFNDLDKILVDYTGCAENYYKGAKPRIALSFKSSFLVETDIRYGILLNLFNNRPNRCKVKIASNGLCPKKHVDLLRDFLTKKQLVEIERKVK